MGARNLRRRSTKTVWSVYLSPFVLREHTLVPFTILMKMPIVGTNDEQYLGGGLFSATSCVDHRAFRFCGV